MNAPAHCSTSNRSRQRGVGMIELLIAMLVVAIGVIGISRMQIAMLKNNQSSLLRSQASLLAYDMIDRMRSDREAALAGDYSRAFGDPAPGTGTVPGQAINAWLDALDNSLPVADGAITQAGADVQITVRWDDTRGLEAPLSYTTIAEL